MGYVKYSSHLAALLEPPDGRVGYMFEVKERCRRGFDARLLIPSESPDNGGKIIYMRWTI